MSGGLERGTSALLIGGAGVGKSSIALTYAVAAAERGERVAMYAFDEGLGTLFARASGLGPASRMAPRLPWTGCICSAATTSASRTPSQAGSPR